MTLRRTETEGNSVDTWLDIAYEQVKDMRIGTMTDKEVTMLSSYVIAMGLDAVATAIHEQGHGEQIAYELDRIGDKLEKLDGIRIRLGDIYNQM